MTKVGSGYFQIIEMVIAKILKIIPKNVGQESRPSLEISSDGSGYFQIIEMVIVKILKIIAKNFVDM